MMRYDTSRLYQIERAKSPAEVPHDCPRTVQGMARVRSGQAAAVTVTLDAGGAGTDTKRAIPGPEPRHDSCTFRRRAAALGAWTRTLAAVAPIVTCCGWR
jgi:hypothetical protein